MTADAGQIGAAQWATASGDIWAKRWRDTDAGLAGLNPHLVSAIVASAPTGSFRALDVGCGPGSTSIAVAEVCAEAAIIACDISPALVELARLRTKGLRQISVVKGDAEVVAEDEGPFDLTFSRHGVMFFPDSVRAFQSFRGASRPGASLVFSCFRGWSLNIWASELVCAAADTQVQPPGREPSGFAFADPDYVRDILGSSGWVSSRPQAVDFRYVAGKGEGAVEHALSFLSDIGPASRILQSLPEQDRSGALQRMRRVIERHFDGTAVAFPAAAWIWRAKAAPA
jgi:SAM-dependent methyltransferase